jgi:Flp pilus assembly protein TadB
MARSTEVLRNLQEWTNEPAACPITAMVPNDKSAKGFVLAAGLSVAVTAAGYAVVGSAVLVSYFLVLAAHSFQVKSRNLLEEKAVDRELPIIAEKLLMAVRSGHDLVPALLLVGKLAGDEDAIAKKFSSFALRCEQGQRLESVLKDEASMTTSIPLKHICLHLGVAYREGGELSRPLEELSDATQNFIEERENEEIAKLPVKATAPLIVIFLGLIIMFITPPMMQIVTSMAEASTR